MVRRWENGQDDADAQVDGETAPFATTFGAQPWLREQLAPWHMWGNTQRFTATAGAFGLVAEQNTQLIKIAYKRPETWHWLFVAVLTEGPDPAGAFAGEFSIDFDVIVGIGRSSVSMRSFEHYQRVWIPPANAPRNQPIYSSSVVAPQRVINLTSTPVDNFVDEIVAQDIQVSARFNSIGTVFGAVYTVDVSAYFAPKTHVRPDWFLCGAAPPEATFAGSETGGK